MGAVPDDCELSRLDEREFCVVVVVHRRHVSPSLSWLMPSAISHQPSAISHQPSAISHQPSAISHQSSAISHQPSAISHDARLYGPTRKALTDRRSPLAIPITHSPPPRRANASSPVAPGAPPPP